MEEKRSTQGNGYDTNAKNAMRTCIESFPSIYEPNDFLVEKNYAILIF